jgi:hypothetical protein
MSTIYKNCLYIHGLHSDVNRDKVDIMAKYFDKVVARHIIYSREHNAYDMLREMCRDEGVNFIIGSSFGGYLGFYLSRELQLPSVLFNPALLFREQDNTYIKTPSQDPSPFSLFVIGELDDVIPPASTEQIIRENDVEDNIHVVKCSWLGHRIDLGTFDAMLAAGIRLSPPAPDG